MDVNFTVRLGRHYAHCLSPICVTMLANTLEFLRTYIFQTPLVFFHIQVLNDPCQLTEKVDDVDNSISDESLSGSSSVVPFESSEVGAKPKVISIQCTESVWGSVIDNLGLHRDHSANCRMSPRSNFLTRSSAKENRRKPSDSLYSIISPM